jgi:hypothetical protein
MSVCLHRRGALINQRCRVCLRVYTTHLDHSRPACRRRRTERTAICMVRLFAPYKKCSRPYKISQLFWFFLAFQKPCTADLLSLRNNHLKAKLLRPFSQRSNLLLAIPGFIVFGPFIDVLLAVFDEPIEQASQLSSHGGNGFRSAKTGTHPAVLRS